MDRISLTGARLRLREYHHTEDEVADLYAIFGDPETARHLPFEARDLEGCADQLQLYVEEAEKSPRTEYRLAVTLRGSDGDPDTDPDTAPAIGHAVLTVQNEHAGVIGYALRRDTWGRGYAGEIVQLLCRFGFRGLGLHRLSARVDPENEASARVLTRAGFQLEGRIREDLLRAGRWHDGLQFSLLEPEWVEPAAGRGVGTTPP